MYKWNDEQNYFRMEMERQSESEQARMCKLKHKMFDSVNTLARAHEPRQRVAFFSFARSGRESEVKNRIARYTIATSYLSRFFRLFFFCRIEKSKWMHIAHTTHSTQALNSRFRAPSERQAEGEYARKNVREQFLI